MLTARAAALDWSGRLLTAEATLLQERARNAAIKRNSASWAQEAVSKSNSVGGARELLTTRATVLEGPGRLLTTRATVLEVP